MDDISELSLHTPFVSIVIPTHNRLAMLQDTLQTLCALDYPKTCYEIIVVDDASTDGTAAWLAAQPPKIDSVAFHPISLPKSGPGVARNTGVRHARGAFIFFTDDDCRIETDCLQELVNAMVREQCGGLAGRITCEELPGVISRYCSAIKFNEAADNDAVAPSFINTANGFYPRQVLCEVGGFDENFPFIGCEDSDLSLRVMARGYELKACGAAIVLHLNKTTFQSLHRAFFNQARGAAYIHAKYQPGQQMRYVVEHAVKLVLNCFRLLLLPVEIVWQYVGMHRSSVDACCFPVLARSTKIAGMWGRIVGRITYWHRPEARYAQIDLFEAVEKLACPIER